MSDLKRAIARINDAFFEMGDDADFAAWQTVQAELERLQGGVTSTEWGVRWPDAPVDEQYEERDSRPDAERIVRQYVDAELVSREVRRGPWTEAQV